MFTYTIIIPHKNSPKLLQRCLDSIPLRDDLEVIVVDDNSDPNIVDFNHFPGLERKNTIVIFDKAGKGAGKARNIGLEISKGQWIVFADADDFFYDNSFTVLDNYVNSKNDIIYFYCNSRDGETLEIIPDRVKKIKMGIDSRNYNLLRYGSSVPWGKMIQRNHIFSNNIRFDEVEVSNDIMFSIKVGYYAKYIDVISAPLYCCTRNKDSLFYNKNNKRMKTRVLVAAQANDFLFEHNLDEYRLNTIFNYIFYFFPNQPLLFIWAVWKGQFKKHRLGYYKTIIKRILKELKRTIS